MTARMLWFDDLQDAADADTALTGDLSIEARIQAAATWPGHCPACARATVFTVCTGAAFAGRANLREGLRCTRCGLTARQRTLLMALRESIGADRTARGALLERFSRRHGAVRRLYPATRGSEFLSATHVPGRRYPWRSASRRWLWRAVRHESIAQLSYATGSLTFIVHSDVLEHVDDTMAALRDCHRVLAPGGTMVLTVPLDLRRDHNVRRGHLDATGALVERLPGEYHGDGLDPRGVYTFHNFGRALAGQLRTVFAQVEVGLVHDPALGLVHADSVRGDWSMSPLVLRARKAP